MKLSGLLSAGALALSMMATSALAGDIMIKDPYIRTSTPSSKSGAAFAVIMNHGEQDDRLIAATSDIAGRVELHTHKEDENGVMKMLEIDGGIVVPANGMHQLKRGGDHIMFMGISRALEQGEDIAVTLTFEKAGDVQVIIPVDRERKPAHGSAGHSHDG